jgi:GntR family transcriptional regulator
MIQGRSSTAIVQQPHRYSAAARRIEEHLRDGGIAAGSRILGERELAKLLGVSRVTLRRALGELKERGILVSDEAKGWFVAPPKVGEQNVLRSFTEMAAALGLTAASQVIRKEVRLARLEEAEALQLVAGAELFDVERIRILAGEPVGIERSRIPARRAPGLMQTDLAKGSLYAALRGAGAGPAVADYVLSATAATKEQARHLRVKPGVALLACSAISRDMNGVPVELSETVFRGDRYRFQTTLKAELR